jgi:hypothetical protein
MGFARWRGLLGITHSEPLDARQLKQWQSEQADGQTLLGTDTDIFPQLHSPCMELTVGGVSILTSTDKLALKIVHSISS